MYRIYNHVAVLTWLFVLWNAVLFADVELFVSSVAVCVKFGLARTFLRILDKAVCHCRAHVLISDALLFDLLYSQSTVYVFGLLFDFALFYFSGDLRF